MERKDFGSWLEGPPQLNAQQWPGQRLGRPVDGPGSVARFGRRLGALAIDWGLAMLVSGLFFGGEGFANLAVFAGTQLLFVGVTGHSIGHRVLGMQVQGMDGRPAPPLAVALRTALLLLVVPPLLADADQRGLHDRAARTVLVRI